MAKTKRKLSSSSKKRNAKVSTYSKLYPRFSFKTALIVALIFGGLGVYLLYRSFAAAGAVMAWDSFTPVGSVNASVVKEYRPGTKTLINVVKINGGRGNTAVFRSTTNLNIGQYKVCAIGKASTDLIHGQITAQQYNGTSPDGAADTHFYNIPVVPDYATFKCFAYQVTKNSPSTLVTVRNNSDSDMRISLIYIKPIGNLGKPTVTLTATPSTVLFGKQSTLDWQATNATSCSASGAWSGSKPTSGSFATGALGANTSYSLTCKGPNGSVRASVVVKVQGPKTGGANPASFIGIGTYGSGNFAQIAQLGIKNVRMDIPAGVNCSAPNDSNFIAAKNVGITILPILDYNYWDGSNGGCKNTGGGGDGHNGVPSQYATTWAQQQIDILKSAMSSAGLGAPEAIEVYNEPWNPTFWRNPNPSDYLALVKATANYAWSRPGWQNVKILVAADTVDTADSQHEAWLQPLLNADRDGFLAKWLIHPTVHNYVQTRDPNYRNQNDNNWHCDWDFSRYDCAYNAFQNHGNPDPQVWVTEFGWRSFGTDSVGESTQALYTSEGISQMRNSQIVEKSYPWMLASGGYTQNGEDWLNGSNQCKQICGTIQAYIKNN